VSSDRAATLRNAEKLLRQGKLEQAITEYLRVVDEQPRDWNTGNIVGDLYARVGKIDKAVEHYIRIADSLSDEGFLQKAGALYKKVLKIKPDHEHAMLQSAEVAASQGLLVDARSFLNAVAERRRSQGDQRGVAQIRIRLGSLDPGDYEARLGAARARVEIKDVEGAIRDFKGLAAELADKGRPTDAIQALREAVALNPEDQEIRERALEVYLASGDFANARECATTVSQLKSIAARLEAIDQHDEALATRQQAARLDPADVELKTYLARALVARGDLANAAVYLTAETAGHDPRLRLALAEVQLRSGRSDEAIPVLQQLITEDQSRRENIAALGWAVSEQSPEAGYQVVALAAEMAVAQSDWASAAAALQEFVTRVPNHIPALMRLVEICVDGGLEATMYSAQAQLADAYIASGSATEARFIAEDLVAREPWDRANIERFRRALVLLGEPNPEALIAERLSGESPFMSTDLFAPGEAQPPLSVASSDGGSRKAATPPPPPPQAQPKAKTTTEIDAPPTVRSRSEGAEVDLSVALDDPVAAGKRPAVLSPSDDLDNVFAQLRDEASRRAALDAADEEYKRGVALHKAGRIDDCIPALQAASRAPRLRFVTASLLGRIYRNRGMTLQAIEWFERAAQAPPPNADEGHLLLYDLADALESSGEIARALVICMELQADAGSYRDVPARIDRLAKVQTRG
jgi:tetratricopeptide (TPR) repeat protein